MNHITHDNHVKNLRNSHGADFVVQLARVSNLVVARDSSTTPGYIWNQVSPTWASTAVHLLVRQRDHHVIAQITIDQSGSCSINIISSATYTQENWSTAPIFSFQNGPSSCTNYTIIDRGVGGVAWLPTSNHSERAFSVVHSTAGALTLAHELGHNMGLAHDIHETEFGSTAGTPYTYGRGHGVNGQFVMSKQRATSTNMPIVMHDGRILGQSSFA